jgi:hypothetical protein
MEVLLGALNLRWPEGLHPESALPWELHVRCLGELHPKSEFPRGSFTLNLRCPGRSFTLNLRCPKLAIDCSSFDFSACPTLLENLASGNLDFSSGIT